MRQPSPIHLILVVGCVFSSLCLAGCAGGRITFHANNSASLQTVEADLQYARLQAESTREALEEMVFADPPDLGRAYRDFDEKATRMNLVGERLVRHADGMEYQGSSYLVEPEKSATECRYPRLSDTARTKPLELGGAFDPIAAAAISVRRAYRAFESDLSNIRSILSIHQTTKRIEIVDIFIKKAAVDEESLNEALGHAQALVQEAKTASPDPSLAPNGQGEKSVALPEGG
uniref:Lipoprotein n=1 Tax=Geobacter sp. (strain M21) TaxID=443144 RepID=C6E7A6_GEOSM